VGVEVVKAMDHQIANLGSEGNSPPSHLRRVGIVIKHKGKEEGWELLILEHHNIGIIIGHMHTTYDTSMQYV
jgi:hypothetical protein